MAPTLAGQRRLYFGLCLTRFHFCCIRRHIRKCIWRKFRLTGRPRRYNQSRGTHSFSQSLQDSDLISVSFDESWTEDEISTRVRLGQEDVGVVLFGSVNDPSAPSIRIIQDPSRKVAATVLKGQIRQMLINHSGIKNTKDFETISALGQNESTSLKDPTVTYYIGATATVSYTHLTLPTKA